MVCCPNEWHPNYFGLLCILGWGVILFIIGYISAKREARQRRMNTYYKRSKQEYLDVAAELKEKYKDQLWFIDTRVGGDDLGKQVDVLVDSDIFDPLCHDSIPRRYKGLDICVVKKPVIRKPESPDKPLV
jgi:hypothetical protein